MFHASYFVSGINNTTRIEKNANFFYDGLHVKVEFEGSLKIENKKLISSKLTRLLCSSTLTMSSVKIRMQNYNFLMNYSKN